MKINYSPENKSRARELRKNMTKQEAHLWYDFLSKQSVRFYRQKQFGPYIVDFYCSKANLVIEIDGSQHYYKEGREYDAERTKYLEGLGLRVIRFTNHDVDSNFNGVCMVINSMLP